MKQNLLMFCNFVIYAIAGMVIRSLGLGVNDWQAWAFVGILLLAQFIERRSVKEEND